MTPECSAPLVAAPINGTRLSETDFAFIAQFAHSEAGLNIPSEKATMVASRLNKQASQVGISDLATYCALLRDPQNSVERRKVISALTTNVTSFLRESHHFDYLIQTILPDLIRNGRAGKRVRIWSAGCSSGQEPYSIAMTLFEHWPDVASHDVKILATDIDHAVLKTAKAGIYSSDILGKVHPTWKANYFRVESENSFETNFEVVSKVRDLIAFRYLNLIKPWPFNGQFDVIFCRNVVIYFAEETQHQLWPRFEQFCKDDGTLFVGHSERVEPEGKTRFRQVANTTYKKQQSESVALNKGSS